MHKLAMCLAPIVVVIACGVDPPDTGAGDPGSAAIEPAARATPLPAATGDATDPHIGFSPCAPGSQDNCTGQTFGTPCVSHPGLVCLPAFPAPNGGSVCSCR